MTGSESVEDMFQKIILLRGKDALLSGVFRLRSQLPSRSKREEKEAQENRTTLRHEQAHSTNRFTPVKHSYSDTTFFASDCEENRLST